MKVTMISKTEPISDNIFLEFDPGKMKKMTTEELVSYAARVSNPENQLNFDTSEKLINYLIKKSHWSPFEMVDVTFEIQTTRDIGRQILRHRSFSFQEFSQRYSEVSNVFETREPRLQDNKNRQSSLENNNDEHRSQWYEKIKNAQIICKGVYDWALKTNIAKEQARAILPEGITQSTMYMKGSLRSWFHYCLVRCHPGTQKEHRDIADEIWKQLQNEFKFFKKIDMKKLSVEYQNNFEYCLNLSTTKD